jgi:hypothetical protein
MRLLLGLVMVVAACGSDAAPAPEPQETVTDCSPDYCVDHPSDWEIDFGDGFATLTHSSETEALGSVGRVDMRAVVTESGGSWPTTPEVVVRSFWSLLDEFGDADLQELEVLADGSVRSEGTLDGGRFWNLLIPERGIEAIGVELRAPSRQWSDHADAILSGIVVLEL